MYRICIYLFELRYTTESLAVYTEADSVVSYRLTAVAVRKSVGHLSLTLSTLGKNFNRRHFEIFFSPENLF